MPNEDRTRHDRLRSLLPQAYAVDARNSALGTLLEAQGNDLATIDRFIERALRDRWLKTASGVRPALEVWVPDGWVVDEEVPTVLREQALQDAETLGLRVVRVLARRPDASLGALRLPRRVLVGESLSAPSPGAFAEESAMLARLRELLLPLGIAELEQTPTRAELIKPSGQPALKTVDSDQRRMLTARWDSAHERLEAALAPAGALIAVVISRGPTQEDGDEKAFADLLANLQGITEISLPALPTLSMTWPQQPLELLGAALELYRRPWELDAEAYRNRVRLLAPMLSRGLGTPRAVLTAALTALGFEPCPRLEHPEPGTTRAHGLLPRNLERCRSCRGGEQTQGQERCSSRASPVVEVTLTDNPLTPAKLVRKTLASAGGELGAPLRVRNNSLFSARPQIRLSVPATLPAETRIVPYLRSLTTGEEIVILAILSRGDAVTLRPASPPRSDPENPIEERRLQRWIDPPAGESYLPARAWLQRSDGTVIEIGDQIIALSGPKYDEARFASADTPSAFDRGRWDQAIWDRTTGAETHYAFRFAEHRVGVESPELTPGDNDWVYRALGQDELSALLDDAELLNRSGVASASPFAASAEPIDIEITWWTRPPACFRIQLPRAAISGRTNDVTYLWEMVDRVRPAGVRPIIDLTFPLLEDTVELSDRLRAVLVRSSVEGSPECELRELASKEQRVVVEPEEQFGFTGVFDVTRFEFSRYAPRVVGPGRFDMTEFDLSRYNELDPTQPGKFDQSYYDRATWRALSSGVFDGARFDRVAFA